MSSLISIKDLNYNSNKKNILSDISLDVEKGKVLAVLGPNGAGKSTFLEIVLADFKPSNGDIKYHVDRDTFLTRKVGVVYNNQHIFPQLYVKEILQFYKDIYRSDGVYLDQLLSQFDLHKLMDSKIRELSEGEKKKLSLALALFHKPEFLVMDEPFANIDVTIMKSIWQEIRKQNATVIIATHDWSFAEQYADEILFLDAGKMLCPKFAPTEKDNILSAKQKLVTQKNEELMKNLTPGDYYEKDEQLNIFMTPHFNIQNIRKITFNYSILDISVRDIFYYLSLPKNIN